MLFSALNPIPLDIILKHLNLLLLAQNPFNLIVDKIIRFIDDVTNLNK